jgi:hypothetical protein
MLEKKGLLASMHLKLLLALSTDYWNFVHCYCKRLGFVITQLSEP